MNTLVESKLKHTVAELIDVTPNSIDRQTPLLGAIPEFDSMAIMQLILALECNYAISIQDVDLTADVFATFGDLLNLVQQSVDAAA